MDLRILSLNVGTTPMPYMLAAIILQLRLPVVPCIVIYMDVESSITTLNVQLSIP